MSLRNTRSENSRNQIEKYCISVHLHDEWFSVLLVALFLANTASSNTRACISISLVKLDPRIIIKNQHYYYGIVIK